MKKTLRLLAALLVGLAVITAAVVTSGIVPVKASSGHLPITSWILHFAMKRSVSTHSQGIEPPPLDNEALVMRGASHFEIGCLWCHGGPGSTQPRIALQMTPHPPSLAEKVNDWDAAELFTIVKHGVKFTGMPAWPSPDRDDEVWAVVAFLQRFPDMEPHEYEELSGRALRNSQREAARQLLTGDSERPAAPPTLVIERCVACHGADGQGRSAHPKLAGQSSEYLIASLKAYRDGQRHSGIMGPVASALSDADIEQAVEYYCALDGFTETAAARSDEILALGEHIAHKGLAKERAGACVECHRYSESQRHRRYPKLAAQNEGYLIQQLHLFRSDARGGTDHAHIMHNIAEDLTDQQIAAVAAYYAHATTAQTEAEPENLR